MDYLALSDDKTFLVSDHLGNIPTDGDGTMGLYYDDTRHLSLLDVRLNGEPLSLLSSGDEDVYRTTALLSNPWLRAGEKHIPSGGVGVLRSRVVSSAVYEELTLTNYTRASLRLDLSLDLAADFADLFQVRGFRLERSGTLQPPQEDPAGILLSYDGGDGVRRSTRVAYDTPPDEITHTAQEAQGADVPARRTFATTGARLVWRLDLPPGGAKRLELAFTPSTGEAVALDDGQRTHSVSSHRPYGKAPTSTFQTESYRQAASYEEWHGGATSVDTDNPELNHLLARSALDLRALAVHYPTGRLFVAGIPWYAVPFGRDSLITSLQTLCFRPELAKGTLRFLAAHQGANDDPWRDEEPGKILHEMRFGELAGTRQIPHTPYYGSVDATPLFVMLFAQTTRWTGDRGLYEELLPNVRRALEWMEVHGDIDGDGYLEYRTRSERGIGNQGWKDSGDSVLYPDGTRVEPPIALVEVQGYVHAAKSWLAAIVRQMGDAPFADRLEGEAGALRERFNRDFWMEDAGFYTQALDPEKRPVRDVTSNPGHALIGGIIPPDRAARVAARLLAPDMASGWGVRTRGAEDPNYNPMSYHNGSVWPHDNAMIAYGMALSGLRDGANEVAEQILAAASHYRRYRLPELYCGFGPHETGLGRPADYPVSCSPQAWAAGTPYLLLQSILGLEPDALANSLRINPHLPPWLERVEVRNLAVGEGRVHLRITREGTEILASDGVDVRVS